jgi:hypothetical protein
MPLFFRQAGSNQFDGSIVYLESLKNNFDLGHATGIIEVQVPPSTTFFLLFARGVLVGAYRLEPETRQRISLADALASLGKSVAPICSLNLPDAAGRAVWLALESPPSDRFEVHGANEWEAFFAKYKAEQFTGQVQIRSKENDGFVFFENGFPISSETTFSTLQGFHSNLQGVQQAPDTLWEIDATKTDRNSQAYQCTLVRLSAGKWGNKLLSRYQDLVGQKLLQTLTHQVSLFIQPRQWNIRLVSTSIFDQHFFPKLEQTVDAYRELFMAIGEQADLVLGSTLSQRLMGEAFNQLGEEERASLEAQRLIPAAFVA